MRHSITLMNGNTGLPVTSGYTISAYQYSATSASAFTGSALYTYSNHADGTYSISVSETFQATIVIFNSDSDQLPVRANCKGILIEGDNQPTLPPS